MKRILKSHIPFCLVIACAILYTYWALPRTYFQQDEWHSFGGCMHLLSLSKAVVFTNLFKGSLLGHFTPLATLFFLFQFVLFGVNFAPYAYLIIFLHAINSLLVYFFVVRLTKERMIGLLTGILFATWYISHQAVTWISAYSAQGAAFFLLLSLIFFLKYQNEKNRRKYYYLSLGMLLVSLGFKEITAFLFIFLPLWGLICIKKERRWRFSWLKEQIPLIICALFYLGLRASSLLTKVEKHSVVMDKSWNYLPITIYNLVMMPLTTISQIFIPSGIILNLIRQLPEAFLKSRFFCNTYTIYTIPTAFVSFLLSLLIIALVVKLVLFLRRQGERERANIILFALIWIGTAVLPFAFLGRPLAFLEGRYYYLSVIGAALLLSIVIFYIADKVKQRLGGFKVRDAVYYGLIGLLVIPILFFHSAKIHRDIEGSIKIGDEQKAILSEIKKAYPVIGKKSVFYTEGLTYPTFHCGFGHVLMVIYAQEGQLNPGFFKDAIFLWDSWGQGYREIEENGFGYFRQYSKLAEAIREFHLSPENVYAFRYDIQTKKLKNITDEIKNRMKYSGMTSYISKQQPDKRLYLGIPDGQRRSFYSEEFVPTEIKEVMNLTDNEEWLPADFIARHTKRAIPGTKDYFSIYNYGLEGSYGGARLVYYLPGNGTNLYSIPDKVYGHKVAGFSSITSPVGGSSIMKKIAQKKDGSFEITLLSACPSSQTIQFTLLLNAKVLYYKPGEGISDIVVGQYVEARGDGKSKKFIISLPGILKSLRSYWESSDLRYQPKAFINGVMTQIISWNGIETSSLTIEFEKPPAHDALIKIPVLVTHPPKPDDIIKIVNF